MKSNPAILGLGLGPEPLLIEEFALEGGEAALAHRVVMRNAHGAHRGPDPDLLAAEASLWAFANSNPDSEIELLSRANQACAELHELL